MTALPIMATSPTQRVPRDRTVHGEGGSVAVLMCFIVFVGGVLATFLVDAGAQIQAANRADTYSAEAARAAAIAIGPIPTGSSAATLQAATAARAYLTQAGATGTVTVTGPATVQVSVTVTENTPILGVTVHQTRTHTAQLQVGVTTGEPVS
jgi:Flp pilus assembly protein TadG